MTADEMFEELGYTKVNAEVGELVAGYQIGLRIHSYIFIYFYDDKTFMKNSNLADKKYITVEELKAINQKCRELGWIE